MKTIYDYSVRLTNGKIKDLRDFQGNPLIIVNTASKCGLTPQFKQLQALYEKYKKQGLEILGFPCDQFNNQEFDNIDKTTQFCQLNYGVTFPVFAKVDVNGENADPLFHYLTEQKKGLFTNKIKWNFTKFLIDQNGRVVKRYAPTVNPTKIEKDLARIL